MNEPLLTGGGSLPDRVYALILEALLSGEFSKNSKLPTESELADRFAVSRPTVREALYRLRADGVIETRRGSGSHVVSLSKQAASGTPPIKSLADIERYYSFRSCIEAGAAAAAAEFRDSIDLDTIRISLEALNVALETGKSDIETDVRFHLAIARASHNPFFVTTMETTVIPVRHFMELARNVANNHSDEAITELKNEHQVIFDAISLGKPLQAAEGIRLHILHAKRRVFEGTLVR